MKDQNLRITEYVDRLRLFELDLEASLELKDWARMMEINEELNDFFHLLDHSGVVQNPEIQQALTRVHILCSALQQVCFRQKIESLEVIKKARRDSSAVSCYQKSIGIRE